LASAEGRSDDAGTLHSVSVSRVLVLALLVACSEEAPRADPALQVERHVEVEELDEAAPIDEVAPPIADSPVTARLAPERSIEPAAAVDGAYDSDEPIEVRRFVYRVRVDVPSVLGEPNGEVETAAAELFVDVSDERLHARFAGPGWPVAAGSEVRLRSDSPGAYVFDERGGRSLLPGELASWFEGGPPRPGPMLVVRRDPSIRVATLPGAGGLLCAFLAEWSGDPRENVMRRCSAGAPFAFRVGYWRGERMAEVPIELPRREVRCDHLAPPDAAIGATTGTFLEAAAIARLRPHTSRSAESSEDGLGSLPDHGLEVVNRSEARILVIVDGVAVGFVGPSETGSFGSVADGVHDVAAMRPLGAVVMRPREVIVPGRTILRAPRRPPPE
jgi:hypothetical protein